MEVILSPQANEDLNIFIKSGNKAILKKITQLIESIQITPFHGIGKPEQLKHELSTFWSRRINREHRIIYKVENDKIHISSLMGHYIK